MNKNVALVLIGLVVGAGAGALATGRVSAQARPAPPPPPPVPRWEQDCELTRGVDEARALAKARGEAGWELVALDSGVMCFKRASHGAPRPPEPWPGY